MFLFVQNATHVVGNLQHHVFFLRTFSADGARIDAAVTGIDHHQPFAAAGFGRRFSGLLAQHAAGFGLGRLALTAEQHQRQTRKQ